VTAAQNSHPGAMGVGAIMAKQSRELLERRESFSWETNMAKQSNYRLFQGYQEQGYRLDVTCVNLQTVELCKNRVAQRVAAGGHPVPEKQIEARYAAGLELLKQNYQVPDRLELVDNSGKAPRTLLILEQGRISQQVPELPKWAAEIKAHILQLERPEPSVAREQARKAFLKSVGPVVQGLKDHGDGLNAGRLQAAARLIERTPYGVGPSKENLEKAREAADQLPTLRGSQELGELKAAVGVMSQVPAQERSGPDYGRESGGMER